MDSWGLPQDKGEISFDHNVNSSHILNCAGYTPGLPASLSQRSIELVALGYASRNGTVNFGVGPC